MRKDLRCSLLLVFVLFLSVSCIEAPSQIQTSQNQQYTPAPPVETEGDVLGFAGVLFEYTANFGLALGTDYRYSATSLPNWASIDNLTGVISGIPTEGQTYLNVIAIASNGTNTYQVGPLSIGISDDPLSEYAWYLENIGQNTFAILPGIAGADINAKGAIEAGYTGLGVKIAISDSGVELNHDDLQENALLSLSKDYSLSAPYFGFPTPSSGHGTAVAGIVAARGWNNIGSRGVAPYASLAGLQFLDSSQSVSILIDQASGDFDIFNYSYGETIYHDTPSTDDYLDQIKYQATTGGRGGKGSVFVKAAGNEYKITRNNFLGVSRAILSHNANIPMENESPYMMVVGALSSDDEKAYYSNAGSNLWISAYGGDFGMISPALITTDLPTCSEGYSKLSSSYANDFEFGHALNSNCNYTTTMNGTSGAVPMVSGAAALLLEANPSLTARDVKHILASTARKAQITYETGHPTAEFDLDGHQYEQEWVTNDAGYSFSNWFGFGVVDLKAAIDMAIDASYVLLDPVIELNNGFTDNTYNNAVTVAIPDASSTGASDTMIIAASIKVETIQIKLSITHDRSGELGIELTSPSGTKSILMNINNSFLLSDDKNLNGLVLTSNAFYGEASAGTWTLKVIDGLTSNSGTLTNWKMNIVGR